MSTEEQFGGTAESDILFSEPTQGGEVDRSALNATEARIHDLEKRLEELQHQVGCADAAHKDLTETLDLQGQVCKVTEDRVHRMDWQTLIVTIVTATISGGVAGGLL